MDNHDGAASGAHSVAPFGAGKNVTGGLEPWSLEVWRRAAPILSSILAHPFVTGLMDGTLRREAFEFYIGQDALYLDDFARALAAAALKAPGREEAEFLASSAIEAIRTEGALHESFLKDAKRPDGPSPSCLLYTSYLHRHLCRSSFPTILASLLPCFRIYLAVGRHILSLSGDRSDNPYRSWINTYGGEEFALSVDTAVLIGDRMAQNASPEERESMTEAFLMTSRMEWMFWDSAFRLEPWPV
jgi:thiaminase/transcriptional activator TenA